MNRSSRATKASSSSGLSISSGSAADLTSSSQAKGAFSNHSSFSDPYRTLYLTRAFAFDQMDIQSALDQMITLCSLTPQRVYKTSYYRKQTKNHWARDDPAFAILEIAFLAVASVAYCVAFKQPGIVVSSIRFAVQQIVVFWFLGGVLISTIGRAVANAYLCHGSAG
eukprot:CAMPEP_0195520152 /NCGR_PEP_ID=MMETSP0794_2-20130614/16274_1 /TAXON_ID=515487 /ORGANISM="Stephanopyxis turris, Strain CCMP 815" /LENGTH=166 /DNA_ID=CAMNT_0040649443 /DNA_START=115 /DNA_END=611 /DNA_ORIENTATION=+